MKCGSNSLCTETFQVNPSYTCSCQIGYNNISGACMLPPPTCSGKSCKVCPTNSNSCYDCSVLGLTTASCSSIPATSLQLFVIFKYYNYTILCGNYSLITILPEIVPNDISISDTSQQIRLRLFRIMRL